MTSNPSNLVFYYSTKSYFYGMTKNINLFNMSFFLFLVASTLIWSSVENYSDWFKSILYFRFLLFIDCNKNYDYKKNYKFKLFFDFCFLITSFVSIDIFLQFFFGKNIIGNLPIDFLIDLFYLKNVSKKKNGGFLLTSLYIDQEFFNFMIQQKKF